MTQPDLARLEELVENIGPLPIDPIWMYEAIRHAQRNMDLDVAEGFCEPDRYAGRPIGELINELPALLARVRELEKGHEQTYRQGFRDARYFLDPSVAHSESTPEEEDYVRAYSFRAALTLNKENPDADR